VDQILVGEVERLVLAHQDRLARFAYSLLVHLCQSHQCELLVMNTEETQPRARVGPGSDHHYPLFQFAFVRVTKLPESLRESPSR
jgi:hypothetical protein